MVSLQARVVPTDDVAHRALGDETVAVNLRTGRYHSLNSSAGRMLEELLAGPTVGAALARLEQLYDVPRETVERDLLALCGALAERGLVAFEEHG
jgi:hypothetical protein